MTDPIVSFGSFQLDATRLELSEGGVRLDVGARACALLLVLLQRKGEIVSSRELLKAAWPGVTVDEVNVRVHVTALRKVLRDGKDGARYIHTIPRRGYRFVGEVAFAQLHVSAAVARSTETPAPQLLGSLVGRAEALELLDGELSSRRIVTIVGPGGIGKTSLALALAATRAHRGEECVFVDLATATAGAHVAESVFAALALQGTPEDLLSYIVGVLRKRSLLLILDNCDQVIDGVARLANDVARGTAKVRILATSREALRAHGEYVHVLGPLETPSSMAVPTAATVLEYAAARLFVEAARAHAENFRLDDDNAGVIGEICRKLDGIPLALELAAATTDFLTVRELNERVDDRFVLLTRGRRTAPPRHKTMLDALEWGHTLLSASAAATMRRLAVFPARFTLADAVTVAADPDLPASGVLDGVAELQSKSFLTADISGDAAEFRFLETIRAFANAKLITASERDAVHRQHALHTLEMLSRMRGQRVSLDQRRRDGWRVVDNLRTAHDWAKSPQGDRRIAIHLLSASFIIWSSLNLQTEFITRARETLVSLPEETPESLSHEMAVQIALVFALSATQQVPSASLQRLCLMSATRAVELADHVGSAKDRIRARWAAVGATIEAGRHSALIEHAVALERLVAPLPSGPLVDRSTYLRSLAHHAVGRFAESLDIVGVSGAKEVNPQTIRASIGESLARRALIARNLWLRGDMTAARELRDEGLAAPLDRTDPYDALFFLTSCAVSIALWDRDFDRAKMIIATLERIAVETSRPGFAAYVPTLDAACERLQKSRGPYGAGPVDWSPPTMALADAMTGIHGSFHRADDIERIRLEPNWAASEHLRAAGEHVLVRGAAGCREGAEALFREALAVAVEQGSLFWELRAAVSIARLWRLRGEADAAPQEIVGIVNRFGSHESCADLNDARSLLNGETTN